MKEAARSRARSAGQRRGGKWSYLGYVSFGVLLAAWWLASASKLVNPIFLPGPDVVFKSAVELIVNGTLLQYTLISLFRVYAGFLVAGLLGVTIGIFLARSPLAYGLIGPVVEAVRPIPPIAWLPLVIIWFGIGEAARISVIFYGAFFPILLNTIHGVRSVDNNLIRAALSRGGRPHLHHREIDRQLPDPPADSLEQGQAAQRPRGKEDRVSQGHQSGRVLPHLLQGVRGRHRQGRGLAHEPAGDGRGAPPRPCGRHLHQRHLRPGSSKEGAGVGARLMHTAETSWITGKPEKKRLMRISILLMANEDFARKNPNTLAAFLRGVARANDDIRNNRVTAANVVAKRMNVPLQEVLEAWNLADYLLDITPDLLGDLESTRDFLASVGSIRGEVDIKAGIDEKPLKAILPQNVTWSR